MAATKFVIVFVAIFMALYTMAPVLAAGQITELEVNGVQTEGSNVQIGSFYRDSMPVKIIFKTDMADSDVRVKVWFSGDRSNVATSERFDILSNVTYARTVSVPLPTQYDNQVTDEQYMLNVVVESKSGGVLAQRTVDVSVQRESYNMEILDINMPTQVNAGDALPIDVVLKNRGSHFADDSFVVARITALGLEDRGYFGDLSPIDQGGNVVDKQDAVENRLFMRIPSNAQPGVYTVEIEANNDNSVTTATKKIVIGGASATSYVVAPSHSKSFGVGETGKYSITLVNSGDRVLVYELVVTASDGLDISMSEPVVAIPAGSSRTVQIEAQAAKAGTYSFAIDVRSGTELVKQENFIASVDGKSGSVTTSTSGLAGNATVLLTVILAIIFVVLLVVLIVLLTRKPEKQEEYGESYY